MKMDKNIFRLGHMNIKNIFRKKIEGIYFVMRTTFPFILTNADFPSNFKIYFIFIN